jgi:hypothetical protein
MGLVTKISPVGIDIPIQGFQSAMYAVLLTKWPVNSSSFNCHGRAYRNQTADGYTPEVFNGSANTGAIEYTEVYFDDTLKALCFFSVGEQTKYTDGSTVAKVSLIFMVNVPALKPNTEHRGDEEIRIDVEKFCAAQRFGFIMTGFETGMDTVFKDYSGWKKTSGIKYKDQQPLHCFKINFDLLYNINKC